MEQLCFGGKRGRQVGQMAGNIPTGVNDRQEEDRSLLRSPSYTTVRPAMASW